MSHASSEAARSEPAASGPADAASGATPAIEALNVAKDYASAHALRDVSVTVQRGELFGLVGPDGAGKTTFLRILAGLLSLTRGTVRIDGIDVSADPALVKQRIGYMSQRFSLSETLTVAENLVYVSEVWHVPRGERRKRVTRLLEFSRLGPFQDRLTRNLSGGMKQKLSLSACLVHQPEILLLDEPTIGVDPVSRRDFWLILYDLMQEGATILLSTPYMDEAERCGRVGFLLDGRLIACGSPAALRNQLGTVILDVRCADSRQARRALHGIAGMEASVPFGEHLHVTVPREGFDVPAALGRARAAGVEVFDWKIREPSLEDVFLAFIHRGADSSAAEPIASKLPAVTVMSARAVDVKGLTRAFDHFVAVDHIDLQVESGTVFGFLGPNGAGKSTTIRMLCGILRPTDGYGTVGGFDIVRQAEQLKSHIGYMSQRFSLYEDLTVRENLRFFAGIYNVRGAQRDARIAWALEMAGLRGRDQLKTAELAGGWRQRLALGCAVLHEPPILFLDEPTSGVDPASRRNFWEMIGELSARGITVFVTTHYMDEAEHCDELALIYGGKVVATGSPATLKSRYMSRVLLELDCSDLMGAFAELKTEPTVAGVALFGDKLHLTAADEAAARSAVTARLPVRGIAVRNLERIEPSLEDTFVAIIESSADNGAHS
jgi:ABC-2 type transport system ATP-binding protein